MKLLVIGGSGLIGSHILQAAKDGGHEAVGTYREHPSPGLARLDCGDSSAMEALLEREHPGIVIHAAGWTWVDGCEDNLERAFAENSTQPAQLARLCHARGIRFAWFSSSYVFDGVDGPYAESAEPRPINVYGQSKLAGERQIQAACDDRALIARVICVYGAEAQRKNFACQVLAALREGRTLTLPADQSGNPTWAGDIARWLMALIEQREAGIWHLGGPWPDCTRPDWAARLVAAFRGAGVDAHANFAIKTLLTNELKQKALRPLKAGIISERTIGRDFAPTPFDQTVAAVLENRACR